MKTPEQFMEYYRSNYPSRTIISNPEWHAPKLYRAAIEASAHDELLAACKVALRLTRPWVDGGITWEMWDDAFKKLEAALLKAEAQ